jgi:hypothetical protein
LRYSASSPSSRPQQSRLFRSRRQGTSPDSDHQHFKPMPEAANAPIRATDAAETGDATSPC